MKNYCGKDCEICPERNPDTFQSGGGVFSGKTASYG